jgi:hypothetical protein
MTVHGRREQQERVFLLSKATASDEELLVSLQFTVVENTIVLKCFATVLEDQLDGGTEIVVVLYVALLKDVKWTTRRADARRCTAFCR